MINTSGKVTFKNIGSGQFLPNVKGQKTSLSLLSEVLLLVEEKQSLILEGSILKRQGDAVWLFTSVGLLELDSEVVEFVGDEVEVIKISS